MSKITVILQGVFYYNKIKRSRKAKTSKIYYKLLLNQAFKISRLYLLVLLRCDSVIYAILYVFLRLSSEAGITQWDYFALTKHS